MDAAVAAAVAAAAASRTILCSHQNLIFSPVYTTTTSKIKCPFLRRIKNSTSFASISCLQQLQSVPQTETHSRANVVNILEKRGLLESVTSDNLRSLASSNGKSFKVYCGFDPTAESLHLGNLLGIIVLSWFVRSGHQAVALIGGATARVGDPSGKSIERPEFDPLTLDKNIVGITNTISTIFGSSKVVILNNYDWWKDFSLLDFLKQVGRFARIGTMIAKGSVKKRLESEQGMSFTEFSYQLLQGYDLLV